MKVASAHLAQAATGPTSSPKQVYMAPSNRAVKAGVAVASAEAAADTLPYGTPQEFDFDTPLGKGKWSIAGAQDGKLLFTAKASAGLNPLYSCSGHNKHWNVDLCAQCVGQVGCRCGCVGGAGVHACIWLTWCACLPYTM